MPASLPLLSEHLSTIILNAAKEHEQQLGMSTLALVLKGSKSKLISNRQLYNSKFFGALFYYPVSVIENFIKQLMEKGHLQTKLVNFKFHALPMLEITPLGNSLLENKQEVSLKVKRTLQEVVLNDSLKETLKLFLEQKDIRKVAQKRNLAESTIWKHLIDAVILGQLSAAKIVDTEKRHKILLIREELPNLRLKELKEALPAEISYQEIRCVLAEEKDGKE